MFKFQIPNSKFQIYNIQKIIYLRSFSCKLLDWDLHIVWNLLIVHCVLTYLTFSSVLVDNGYCQDGLKDIKPPVFFPPNFWPWIILGILLLIGLVVLFIKFLINRLKKEKEFPLEPPKPPHQLALEALEALKSKNYPLLGRIKEYYSELSDIVRHYIEARFNIRAPEMTTEEFFYSLRNSADLSGTQKNLLKEFLSQCDMVKFAKYGPTEKEIDNSFNSARHFIEETKQVQVVEKVQK